MDENATLSLADLARLFRPATASRPTNLAPAVAALGGPMPPMPTVIAPDALEEREARMALLRAGLRRRAPLGFKAEEPISDRV